MRRKLIGLSLCAPIVVGAVAVFTGCGGDPAEDAVGEAQQPVSVHFKGGAKAGPSFFDEGLQLRASGALAGLGNGDVVVDLIATGHVFATCTNPGSGEHKPPGQNPADATLSGTVTIPDSEIKNGTTPFVVETGAPTTPVPGAPQCPNSMWIEDITDVAFTGLTLVVKQGGQTVLTVSCTINPPSADGPVPKSHVTCTTQ